MCPEIGPPAPGLGRVAGAAAHAVAELAFDVETPADGLLVGEDRARVIGAGADVEHGGVETRAVAAATIASEEPFRDVAEQGT